MNAVGLAYPARSASALVATLGHEVCVVDLKRARGSTHRHLPRPRRRHRRLP